MALELKKATPEAVRYACLNFHYSKTVPQVKVGFAVFEDGEWCGVICYGGGANNHIGSPYGLQQGQILELVRVALNGKQKSTSQCLAVSIKLLKKMMPQVKMLVSYADTEQGHIGTIYQATNWYYSDESKEQPHIFIRGRKVHARSAYSKYGTNSIEKLKKYDPDCYWIPQKIKIKYLYPLHEEMRAVCKGFSKPYPKKQDILEKP